MSSEVAIKVSEEGLGASHSSKVALMVVGWGKRCAPLSHSRPLFGAFRASRAHTKGTLGVIANWGNSRLGESLVGGSSASTRYQRTETEKKH